MKNDPRVAQQPMFVPSQSALDAALKQMMVDDPSFAEMYVKKKEAEKLRQSISESAAIQNAFNNANNYGGLQSALAAQGFAPSQYMNAGPVFPQFPAQQEQNATPPPLDEESPRADAAQEQGLAKMNPIARHRFEPIIKLMGIKVRYTTATLSLSVHQWILARMGKDGRMIRQEWTAPSKDPGCSLRTWEAMIGEFLDEVARRDGTEIPTDTDQHNGSAGAGNEASGSAGNT